jgi:hypothetical protein
MAERLDPFQNIIGVGWREEDTEGTEEPFPKPEYHCEFICGSSTNESGMTEYRGLSTAWYTGVIGEYMEYPTESIVTGKKWHLNERVVLLQAIESVTNRGIFAGVSPASSWQLNMAWVADNEQGWVGGEDLVDYLDGKYIIWNGYYSHLIPRLYKRGGPYHGSIETLVYPAFGPTGFPPPPTDTRSPARYGPLQTTVLFTPTSFGANGDADPPGGKYVLGFDPGSVHTMWLVDSLDEVTE